MHHLAPAPGVARAAQPPAPERHGGVELGGDVGFGKRRGLLAVLEVIEHEGGGLPGPDLDVCTNVAAVDDLERAARQRLSVSAGERKSAPWAVSATSWLARA